METKKESLNIPTKLYKQYAYIEIAGVTVNPQTYETLFIFQTNEANEFLQFNVNKKEWTVINLNVIPEGG